MALLSSSLFYLLSLSLSLSLSCLVVVSLMCLVVMLRWFHGCAPMVSWVSYGSCFVLMAWFGGSCRWRVQTRWGSGAQGSSFEVWVFIFEFSGSIQRTSESAVSNQRKMVKVTAINLREPYMIMLLKKKFDCDINATNHLVIYSKLAIRGADIR